MGDKKLPILVNILDDPSCFGGPTTFRDIAKKNNYIGKYQEYAKKMGDAIAMEIYRPDQTNRKYDQVLYHFQFQSMNQESIIYDVVLRFYAQTPALVEEPTISKYYLQIFSNSPGFAFQYAYAYHKMHLLPEILEDRFTQGELSIPPEKSNPKKAIGYDYTVFFALYHLKLNKYYLAKKEIDTFGKNLLDFDPEDIATTKETLEQRTRQDVLGFHALEKKAKSIKVKAKKQFDSFFGTNISGRNATHAKRAQSTQKASRARSATGARKKKGFFN